MGKLLQNHNKIYARAYLHRKGRYRKAGIEWIGNCRIWTELIFVFWNGKRSRLDKENGFEIWGKAKYFCP